MGMGHDIKVRGSYEVQVTNSDGSVDKYGPCKNLLTNYYFQNKITSCCIQVGSGTTPAQLTDTVLENPISSSNSSGGSNVSGGNVGGNVWSLSSRLVADFGLGNVVGNVSEVGARNTTSSSTPLYSRSLLTDSNGNPLSIPVDETQQLKIVYIFELLFDATPKVYENVIVDTTPMTLTLRANNCNDPYVWARHGHLYSAYYFIPFDSSNYKLMFSDPDTALLPGMEVPGGPINYSESLGDITISNPNDDNDRTFVPIDNDSCSVVISIELTTSQGNQGPSNFIYSTLSNNNGSKINYSIELSDNFEKTDQKTLNFDITIIYSRA